MSKYRNPHKIKIGCSAVEQPIYQRRISACRFLFIIMTKLTIFFSTTTTTTTTIFYFESFCRFLFIIITKLSNLFLFLFFS